MSGGGNLAVSAILAQLPENVLARLDATGHRLLLECILAVLTDDERFLGAWLWGSFSRGEGDANSDLDLYVVVDDANHSAVIAEWEEIVERIAPTLSKILRPFGNTPILAVLTAEWQRFDLILVPLAEVGKARQQPWLYLFDRADVTRRLGPVQMESVVSPDHLRPLVENFFWVLGMLTVPIQRQDYLLGTEGVLLLRGTLRDLMFLENGATHGGVMWRYHQLSAAQRRLLESLPPLEATRESVITGHAACLEIFRPLARRLLDRYRFDYPEQLERATLIHIRQRLGLERL
jgi:predicted nucleotidyltransferase